MAGLLTSATALPDGLGYRLDGQKFNIALADIDKACNGKTLWRQLEAA